MIQVQIKSNVMCDLSVSLYGQVEALRKFVIANREAGLLQ